MADLIVNAFPPRNKAVPAEQQGIFEKFTVIRNDGSSEPGGKHDHCQYFVLDLNHDPHAKAAMQAYAMSCKDSHPLLSDEILTRYGMPPEYKHVGHVQVFVAPMSRTGPLSPYVSAQWTEFTPQDGALLYVQRVNCFPNDGQTRDWSAEEAAAEAGENWRAVPFSTTGAGDNADPT